MAMIFPVELPPGEKEKIAEFLGAEEGADPQIPELSEDGAKALDSLTDGSQGLWRTVIGRFVEYEELPYKRTVPYRLGGGHHAQTLYRAPSGEEVTHADFLYDANGESTNRRGAVETDYVDPEGVYVVGAPL